MAVAKFEFKLEAVLEQRRGIERQKQLALGQMEAKRIEVESRVAAVRARLDERRSDLRERLSGGGAVEVGAVRLQSNAALFGMVELRRLAIELAGVMKRVEAARADLLRATIARKAIEHLRTKAYEAWKRDLAKREAAELDDLTLMRLARAGGGDGDPSADLENVA